MWLLIAHICWADLVTSRKFGRRLVSALLDHLHIVCLPPNPPIVYATDGTVRFITTPTVIFSYNSPATSQTY